MSESMRARRERLKKKSTQAAVLNMFGGDGQLLQEQSASSASATAAVGEEEEMIGIQEDDVVQSATTTNLFSDNASSANQDAAAASSDESSDNEESENEFKNKMSAAESSEDYKVFVEIGRVALIQQKRYKNKLAVIVNVVDQRRAICDIFHPHGKDVRLIARASIAFKTIRLTKLMVEGIHWNSHSKFVTDKYAESKIQQKFQATKYYQAWQNKMKRDNMNDYERFKCEFIKRKRNAIIRKKMTELNKAK